LPHCYCAGAAPTTKTSAIAAIAITEMRTRNMQHPFPNAGLLAQPADYGATTKRGSGHGGYNTPPAGVST